MPILHVESIDDPRIAVYRNLPTSRQAERSGLFVVEGRLLADRLLASSYDVKSLLLEAQYADHYAAQREQLPVFVAPHGLIEQIIGFHFHRGILGCGRRRDPRPLSEVIPLGTQTGLALVAVDVRDPENLGGMLRNAAAFGVRLALLSRECADPFSRRVARVSMGTNLTLDICRPRDLRADLLYLRETCGWDLVATVLDPCAEPLSSFKPSPGMALLLGSEGHGLAAEWVALCNRQVTIPMRGGTDSLNVAVASGIFLHSFTHAPGA